MTRINFALKARHSGKIIATFDNLPRAREAQRQRPGNLRLVAQTTYEREIV